MAAANLDPDFKELLRLLNLEKVKYLLLGGYAVNFHGYQRFTGDMDIWVSTAPENSRRLSSALQQFGFNPSTVAPEKFQELNLVFQFGRVPVRVDILTGPSGVDFDSCYARRVNAVLDGISVSIISLQDLKVNKRASGRLKDLADLENLPPRAKKLVGNKRKKKR